jgi:hypothetical protein
VLRRIFGPKKDEVTGEWRKIHNEELNDPYSSPTIEIKKNEIGGECSTYGRRGEVCTGFWWETLRERDHWRDPGVDGRIILRRIFRKWKVGVWTGLRWLRIETCGGHL